MKTTEDIQKQIDGLIEEHAKAAIDKAVHWTDREKIRKRNSKAVARLRKILTYLEFKPSEYALRKQRDHISGIIDSRLTNYEVWASSNMGVKNPRSEFNKVLIKPLKDKVNALNFILNEK